MLRQSVKGFAAARGLDLAALLAAAGLEPTVRAEEVEIAGFVRLARAAEQCGLDRGLGKAKTAAQSPFAR